MATDGVSKRRTADSASAAAVTSTDRAPAGASEAECIKHFKKHFHNKGLSEEELKERFCALYPEIAASYERANASVEFKPDTAEFQDPRPARAPLVVVALWMLIFLYGCAASFVTGTSLVTIPLFYVLMMVAFVFWHWFVHQPASGIAYKIHTIHHWEVFPPDRLYGWPWKEVVLAENLLDLGYGDMRHEGVLYALIVCILVGGFFAGCSIATLLFVGVMMAAIGVGGSALHTSFHIKGFFLEKFKWYRELRSLHFLHHVGSAKSNYAVLNFQFEKLLGNFHTNVDEVREADRQRRAARKVRSSKKSDAADDDKSKTVLLPSGVSAEDLAAASGMGALASAVLGLHTTTMQEQQEEKPRWAVSRGPAALILRLVVVAALAWFWYATQAALAGASHVEVPAGAVIADKPMQLLDDAGWHTWLRDTPGVSVLVVQFVSVVLHLATGILLIKAVASHSARPVASLLCLVMLRQAVQFVTELPLPQGSLWKSAGESAGPVWQGALLSWELDNDVFFALAPAVVLLLALEIAFVQATFSNSLRAVTVLITLLASAGMGAALVAMHSNWTLSVLTGWLTAAFSFMLAHNYRGAIESLLP